MSRTEDAVKYVDGGMTPYAAAKLCGISPTTVYVALKRREANKAAGKVPCPCCGTMVDAARLAQNRGGVIE